MRRGRPVASRVDRRARARALAGFYLAGAFLSTIVLLLPGWDDVDAVGIAGTVVLAVVGAGMLYVFAERFAALAIHAVTASGTLLIAACQVFAGGGSPTAMYAMLYVWVILHSAMFFPRTVGVAQLALTTVAHAGALVWLGDIESIAPQLALTLVTQLAAGLIVGSLAAQQRQLADTDSLTGLGNRREVERALESATARTRRHGAPTCVAVLDLDGFKDFNDQRGHAAGDRVLVEAAARWQELVRATDTLCRTGGDEFLVVLAGCELDEAQRIVRRMVAATPEGVSCSAGLARWDGREPPGMLIERADEALYTAKTGGDVAVAPAPPKPAEVHGV